LILWGKDQKELLLFPDLEEVRRIAIEDPNGPEDLAEAKQGAIAFLTAVGPTLLSDVLHTVIDVGLVAVTVATGGAGGVLAKAGTTAGRFIAKPFLHTAAGAAVTTAGRTLVPAMAPVAVSAAIPDFNIGGTKPGEDAASIAARYGYEKPKNTGGVFGAVGGALADTANRFARILNPLVSSSGRHDYDSTSESDILTGFDDRYPPVVRLAAKSIANINQVALDQVTAKNTAYQTEQQAKATAQLDESKYQRDAATEGTAEYYYNAIVNAAKAEHAGDANAMAQADTVFSQLEQAPNKEQLIRDIKKIGRTTVNGKKRYETDLLSLVQTSGE
jgi:hypothetical protein